MVLFFCCSNCFCCWRSRIKYYIKLYFSHCVTMDNVSTLKSTCFDVLYLRLLRMSKRRGDKKTENGFSFTHCYIYRKIFFFCLLIVFHASNQHQHHTKMKSKRPQHTVHASLNFYSLFLPKPMHKYLSSENSRRP